MSTAGYEVIENKKSKNYFDLEFLINHLIWALGINKTFKFNLFKKISCGLKLGNIIFVAQPKKKNIINNESFYTLWWSWDKIR